MPRLVRTCKSRPEIEEPSHHTFHLVKIEWEIWTIDMTMSTSLVRLV